MSVKYQPVLVISVKYQSTQISTLVIFESLTNTNRHILETKIVGKIC